MAKTLVYEKILVDLRAGELEELERKVLDVLEEADGQTVTRADFICKVYGYFPQGGLGNSSHDRKIRTAIKSLRDKGATFIVSSSGEAGYRIDTSIEKAEEMAGEMEKRAKELSATAERIRAALVPVTLPESVHGLAHPTQMSFYRDEVKA